YNVEDAKKALKMDDEVDKTKVNTLHTMMDMVSKDPTLTGGAVTIILIAKNLERIADHLTNIAEESLYISSGLDIRHRNIEI
ncbi:MAG: PhoU domain-containing protein, partial [Planctomycetota bacterium]